MTQDRAPSLELGTFIVHGRRYPCPHPDVLKFGEAHFIQQQTGLPSLRAYRAMGDGDSDALAAFLVVSMRRAGRRIEIEELYDLELGALQFEVHEQEEDEQGPPPVAASAASETPAADSSQSGDQAATPASSGSPSSGTS